jgi:beta-mannosidase
MTTKHELDLSAQTWSVRMVRDGRTVQSTHPAYRILAERSLPAGVPGCIHLDLIRAGVIEHPDIGFAERDQFWVGRSDWEYACRFQPMPDLLSADRVELVCEGLDTIASLWVNDQPIGSAANMFCPHRFDVAGALKAGTNTLRIRFTSPLNHIESQRDRLGTRPANGDWDPYIFIRKSACNFGWDWGPKVPTVGIWRPIRIEAWNTARIRTVRPLVLEANDERAVVQVVVEIESTQRSSEPLHLEATLIDPDGNQWSAASSLEDRRKRTSDQTHDLTIEIDAPRLWWPHGQGDQPLYDLTVQLTDAHASLDHWQGRIGLRTVRLRTNEDQIGSEFTLQINGRDIFCKGSNWIPNTPFPTEMTSQRYRERVAQAQAANMNMLRVWGGGFYEDEAFYRACDEMGILVWQDFMFACAMYPEEDPYPSLIEAEARANVTRLCAHPGVVLWCGGNECIWGYQHWGWKERLEPDQSWGKRYYLDLLPAITAQLDPTRPYVPNSPWSGSMERSAIDTEHGDHHTWDKQFEAYREIVPRFISEFGRQSPPTMPTLRAALTPGDLRIDSDAMHHRQRATGGNEAMYTAALGEWFQGVETFDQWHYLTHLLQCRAVRLGVEWARANQPRCMGVLTWQHNDCWAGHSWSAIDSDGKPKPVLSELREAFKPIHGSIQPMDNQLAYVLSNETRSDQTWTATARRMRFDGEVLRESQMTVNVPAGQTTICADFAKILGEPTEPSFEFIDVSGRCPARWFYQRDKDLRYPLPRLTATLDRLSDRHRLTVHATTLIRDALLDVDRVCAGAHTEPRLRSILPGETATWDLFNLDVAQARDLIAPPVFQCANWFGLR